MRRAQAAELDRQAGRQARLAGGVMATTMVLWLVAQTIGAAFGLPGRYAFLFDFAAVAALVWALVVTYQVWRKRRASRLGE